MKVITCGVLVVASACATLVHAQPAWATPTLSSQEARPASLESLLRATRDNPKDSEAWINLGQRYLDDGALERAKESFLEAIAVEYLSAEAHFGLGLTEYARGDFTAALFEFGEVARLFPTRFDGHFNRAVTLAKLRRSEEAVVAFQEAIVEAEPEASLAAQVGAYRGLAEQLKVLERFEEAAEAYDAALAFTGQDAELTYLRAEALYRAGQGLEALPSLSDLEGDYRVDALIADIYAQAGQSDYALRSLTRAARNAASAGDTDTQARLLVQLGSLQRDLGREADAATSFGRAVQVDPGSSQALYNLGLSYLELGQLQAALTPLQQALTLGDGANSGATYLALASAYDRLAQPDEALRNAEAATQRLSDADLRSDATFIVGRSLYRLGDYRGALIALEEVVAAQPDNANAQLWAGLAHYQAGQYRSAAQFYERAVQLNPESLEARINLGAAYLASERYEDAELVYELLIRQTGGDADTFYNLGWSLLSQGRGNEARQAWQRSSELGYTPARTALSQYF